MDFEPKTIAEQIDCLARLTGATEPFIQQVRCLFEAKGISLDADATPYLKALEEAFAREESIRQNAAHARGQITRVEGRFRRVNDTYAKQIRRLRKIQEDLHSGKRRTSKYQVSVPTDDNEVEVPGGLRMYVTRPQRDTVPMVPGPSDLQ